jgi:MFS family permease
MDAVPARQHHQLTLLILGVGALAFALAQTTVIPALTDLQRTFHTSTSGITWLVTAYFLVASVATPVLGRMGDMFGKERLLAISLALFALGSVVCALAGSLGVLIVGRGLQGLGGGVFPLSFGIVRDEFPRDRVPTGIALLGAIAGIGGSIGLPLGGLLADHASYHWIFWLAAAMGAIATVTTIRFVPESPVRSPGRVDVVGGIILTAGSPRSSSRSRARTTGAGPPRARSGSSRRASRSSSSSSPSSAATPNRSSTCARSRAAPS